MARPSLLDKEPHLREVVAELYIDGKTNAEIAEAIGRGVHKDSITTYRRRPDVQQIIDRLSRERESLIKRKIDSTLLARLEHSDKMDTEILLRIRKEILPKRLEVKNTDDRGSITDELFDAADKDPAVAVRLLDAMESAQAKKA